MEREEEEEKKRGRNVAGAERVVEREEGKKWRRRRRMERDEQKQRTLKYQITNWERRGGGGKSTTTPFLPFRSPALCPASSTPRSLHPECERENAPTYSPDKDEVVPEEQRSCFLASRKKRGSVFPAHFFMARDSRICHEPAMSIAMSH